MPSKPPHRPRVNSRSSQPFGLENTPFDPRTGKHFSLSDQRVCDTFTVEVIEHDFLHCRDNRSQLTLIALPGLFQRKTWVGQEITYPDGLTVAYANRALHERLATQVLGEGASEDPIEEVQRLTPSYYIGEEITAIRRSPALQVIDSSGLYDFPRSVYWEDLNVGGRCWAVVPAASG